MATVKEILSKDQLFTIEDFSIEETDKILAHIKVCRKVINIELAD